MRRLFFRYDNIGNLDIINWQAGFILVDQGSILTRIPSYPCEFDSAKSQNTKIWSGYSEIRYYQNHMGSIIL